jgi:hypothetical protein
MQLAAEQIFFSMQKTITKPTFLAFATLLVCLFALVVFADQSSSAPTIDPSESFFKWFGYVGVTLSALGLAVAAIYAAWKKQALTEAKELAQTRKEKLIEAERDKAKLLARNLELERENEELEKKNLRLQDLRDK